MFKDKSQSGFTLIELLVAITIFALLSSFMVASFVFDEKARSLKEHADLVLAGIDQARNLALAGSGPNNVYYQQFIFTISDCQANCSYIISGKNNGDEPQEVISKNLEKVSVELVGEASGQLPIVFSVPRGRMTLPDPDKSEAKIQITNGTATFCIQVNSVSGKVEELKDACP